MTLFSYPKALQLTLSASSSPLVATVTNNLIQMSMEPRCEKLLSQMGTSPCTPREVPFRDNINYTSLALDGERASKCRSGV